MFTQLQEDKRALYFPTTDIPRGVVLYLPGFPKYPSRSSFVEFFTENGYAVLMPMYSGTFDSGGRFSIQQSVKDTHSWYTFLTKGHIQYGPNVEEATTFPSIILFSTSFGGLVAELSLRKHILPQIEQCFFVSPLWDMPTHKESTTQTKIADETSELMEFAYPKSYRFQNKQRFFEEIKGNVPLKHTDKHPKDANRKVAIFCGKDDEVTPVEMSRSLAQQHENAEMHIVKGGHSSKINWSEFIPVIKKEL